MSAPFNLENSASPEEPVNANESVEVQNTQTAASGGDQYVVKTPWTLSLMQSQDGSFPDVTPEGTTMSGAEKDAAKVAAKAIRVPLSSEQVGGNN